MDNIQASWQYAAKGRDNPKERGCLFLDTVPNMLFVECFENHQLSTDMEEKATRAYTL